MTKRRKPVPPGNLVAVRWLDAWEDMSKSLDDIASAKRLKPWEMVTYGILLRHDRQAVVVSVDHVGDYSYRGIIYIPTGMVVEIIDRGEAEPLPIPAE